MRQNHLRIFLAYGLLLLFFFPGLALANKSKVSIEAPAEASPGSTITIKLNVTHKGNSGLHHTNWVSLKINGTEVKRWEYTRKERPESADFSLSYTYKFEAPIEIIAQANCNIHGSEGPASFKVSVK